MPLITKPEFNTIWATSGSKVAPAVAKVSQGWVVEIPPFEYENWVQNRQDQMLAHLNQLGIPMWDATVEYQINKSYIQGTVTGNIYRCARTNINTNPENDISGNWVLAFEPAGTALLRAQNLADIPNKALARTNLGIATTTDYDLRYLLKSQNLADVPNKASARSNLGLGNSALLNVGTAASTVAAGNDPRIVAATPNTRRVIAGLGLTGGGALTSDVTVTMTTPSTITSTTTNAVSSTTHTHAFDLASFFGTIPTVVTNQRVFGQNYTNTNKFRTVSVVIRDPNLGNVGASAYVNNVLVSQFVGVRNGSDTLNFLVPPSAVYRVVNMDDNDIIDSWVEYL